MRADRLVATLLLLQQRGRLTAADVAEELEVSVATARRDLEALGSAGVPVYAQPGRGGGWHLVGGARTDLSGLTAGEAEALFTLVGPGVRASAELRSALRKLTRALPATFRDDAAAAASSVRIDATRWGDRPPRADPLRDLLQQAIIRRARVRLGYRGRAGSPSSRVVDPYGLVAKDDVWYLVAGTDAGRRTFRLDRVTGTERLPETFTVPADFDLDAVWAEIVDEVEERRSELSATVAVPTRDLWVLQRQFGRHCTVIKTAVDPDRTRMLVRIAASSALDLARVLAGWGSTVEVLEPDSVRAELARLGTELTGRYAPDQAGTCSSIAAENCEL